MRIVFHHPLTVTAIACCNWARDPGYLAVKSPYESMRVLVAGMGCRTLIKRRVTGTSNHRIVLVTTELTSCRPSPADPTCVLLGFSRPVVIHGIFCKTGRPDLRPTALLTRIDFMLLQAIATLCFSENLPELSQHFEPHP